MTPTCSRRRSPLIRSVGPVCFCFFLITPVPSSVRAQEKPDRMAQIIDNVRANEELYRNIEVMSDATYKLVDTAGNASTQALSGAIRRYRAVTQDHLFYFSTNEMEVKSGGEARETKSV